MKLLILDVDGVMTDGTKVYGVNGVVIGKRFCDHDFTAIKKFQARGWVVCWLSADYNINEAVAQDRGIPFYYSRYPDGTIDKVKWFEQLKNDYAIAGAQSIYVGDDLLDIPIMQAVLKDGGSVYYPATAAPQLEKLFGSDGVLGRGGNGAIMQLYFKLFPDDYTPPRH